MVIFGIISYSVNEFDVFKVVFGKIGVVEIGCLLEVEDIEVSWCNLNFIIKQWVLQVDFVLGLKMWIWCCGWLFLQKNQIEYDFGLFGDECVVELYVFIMLIVNVVLGVGIIIVVLIIGFVSVQCIGVFLDLGLMQWMIINGVLSGFMVMFMVMLIGVVFSGVMVYVYISKVFWLFEIVFVVLCDSDGNDMLMDLYMFIGEYEFILLKSEIGMLVCFYFEVKKINVVVYLDCVFDDMISVVRLVYFFYVEDLMVMIDDVDFLVEWYWVFVG